MTAEVEINGQRRVVQFINRPKVRGADGTVTDPGLHSEQAFLAWHQRMTTPRSGGGRGARVRVLRVHTERRPCTRGPHCASQLGERFGADLEVYHNQERGRYRPIPAQDLGTSEGDD